MRQFLKKRLGYPLVLVGLAILFTLALGADTHAATSFVGTSTIQTTSGGATVLERNKITGDASLGQQYVNNTGSNIFGAAGDVRVVGSDVLTFYVKRNGAAGPANAAARFDSFSIAAVFALEGSVPGGLTSTVFTATTGRVGLFTIPDVSSYDPTDPTTWGATNAAGTVLSHPIAVWDLKAPETVVDPGPSASPGGGTGVFNLTPGQVNQISINAAVGTDNQGNFLTRESNTYTGPSPLVGNSFITVTGNGLPPAGFAKVAEGLIAKTNESIIGGILPDGALSGGAGSPGFVALNTIAGVLGSLPNLGGPGSAFATGYGGQGNPAGPGTDFNPSNGMFLPNTADLFLTLGLFASPTVQAAPIPEPASIILFIGGGFAACVLGCLRRFRGKRTEVC